MVHRNRNSRTGISWVPDTEWSQGKCGLKILQYMAAGLPVIANPVGVHRDLVTHGKTGFLVETPQQFIEAVQTLASNPTMRKRMGDIGRRRVEQEFDVSVGAGTWLRLLNEIKYQLSFGVSQEFQHRKAV